MSRQKPLASDYIVGDIETNRNGHTIRGEVKVYKNLTFDQAYAKASLYESVANLNGTIAISIDTGCEDLNQRVIKSINEL